MSSACRLPCRESLSGCLTICSTGIVSLSPRMAARSVVDAREVARFARLASAWHDADGAFRALHSMNAVRVPWIVGEVKKTTTTEDKSTPHVLDVGCGGGILSLALARRGLRVTGVDACADALRSATDAQATRIHDEETRKRLEFRHYEGDCLRDIGVFDGVIASEVAEHVPSLSSFVASLAGAAKPGAPLLFTTINRTLLSRVAAVWVAENLLGIVPQGMHDYSKLVRPTELASLLAGHGCTVTAVVGLDYNPVTDRWSWTDCTAVNYALAARKL